MKRTQLGILSVLLILVGFVNAQYVDWADITEIVQPEGIYGPWFIDASGYRMTANGQSSSPNQAYRWETGDFLEWQEWMSPGTFGGSPWDGSLTKVNGIASNGSIIGQLEWPQYIYDADGDTIPDTLFNAKIAAIADANQWGTWVPLGVLDDTLAWGGTNFGEAQVVSADGNIIAGTMATLNGGSQPFVYRLDSMSLDTLDRLQYGSNSNIKGMNADGSVIIGTSNLGWSAKPYIWTLNGDGGYDTTRVDSPFASIETISNHNGHMIAGGEWGPAGIPVYLVTNIDGVDTTITLPNLPGLIGGVGIYSVADDGTCFGTFQEAGGPWGGPTHPYMYHHEGGAVHLGEALEALGVPGALPQGFPMNWSRVMATDSTGKKLFVTFTNDFWEWAGYWVELPSVVPPVHFEVAYTDDNHVTPAGIDLSWENVFPYAYTYKVEYSYMSYGAAWGDWIELATDLDAEEYHQDIADGGYYKWRVRSLYGADESVTIETDVYEVRRFADAPTVTAVADVPEDQGGKVIVEFIASGFDILGGMTNELYTVQTLIGETWVAVATTAAYGSDDYAVQVNTINDSVDEGATNSQEYRVVAALGADVFISEPMSGYSVDNIAPPAPAGVVYDVVDASIQLDWAPLNINDLGIYRVYRATSADMSDAVMIGESALNSYSDETVDFNQDGTYYYAIAGVDIHENEGDASEAVQVGVVGTDAAGQLPTEFALMQNYPNPFNPSTQIQFALPEAAAVTLIVYDLTGREVVRLTDGQTSAGYHTMTWNGLNAYGDVVPAGMYIYRLQAGEFSATKRMIYLQ